MDVSKYKDMFVEEASQNLREMGDSLEKLLDSSDNQGEIDVLFRHAHSIKGMAASMSYNNITEISHKTEDLMDRVRSGKQEMTKEIKDLLFEVVDFLQTLVDMVASDSKDFPDSAPLMGKIFEAGKAESGKTKLGQPIPPPKPKAVPVQDELSQEESAQKALEGGRKIYKIHLTISEEAPSPAARVFLLITQLEEIGQVKKTHPPQKEIEQGNVGEGNQAWLFLVSEAKIEKVEEIIGASVELSSFKVEEVTVKPSTQLIKEQRSVVKKTEKKRPAPKIALPSYRKPASVKVDTPELDNLINIVGEMMIQERYLFDFLKDQESPKLKDCHMGLQRSIKGIHNQVMKFRMMPLAALVDMFPRAIRELQRGTGKEVDLTILGKDVRLDRSILEELGDPLLHLIRNSIDHGLESSEEREKAGKEPVGKLGITAWKEKDLAYIQIEDDGRGIDAEKVKKKAVERGVISAEDAEKLSEPDTLMLICSPGLSTAEKVTNISGRGVGMDVVKTAIENLGGNLFIDSTPGKGTKFSFKLPMTLAIIKTFLVRQRELLLAVPLTKLLFVLEIPSSEIKSENGKQFFVRQEESISLVRLNTLLKFPAQNTNGKEHESVIGVEIGNRKVGLVVDHLLSNIETVIKPLGLPLSKLGYYSGAIVTGTGEMALVLDVEKFAERVK